MNTWTTGAGSGWKVSGGEGYLHYRVWAFCLAKHSVLRGEHMPSWINFLNSDVKKSFMKSMKYLQTGE
ncbi:hypothetical protein [Ekhidna sp.]|uniref:hypothetical protein n=1 Tax=Ekhidna sp. TaxID=2608089 RepID=UPI0032970182